MPAVLKPQTPWVVDDHGRGTRLVSELVTTADEASRRLEWMLEAGASSALLQPWLPGRREAVSLFRADGRTGRGSHRSPIGSGPCSAARRCCARASRLPPDITDSSERLVEAMDLDGCSMVEFRRDRDGRPVLMEVNARMGSSVALAGASRCRLPEPAPRLGDRP